ncbi:MAG: glycosyltransferase [Actinomycetota bacterium]|nr:glycosyltransferase [Actinomycetota bacterium]
MHVGIDIEQFATDPYGSGIQRVLQYLAREWPGERVQADFVVPRGRGFALLSPVQAADVLSVPFEPRAEGDDLRAAVARALDRQEAPVVMAGDLLALYDAWLLPEVSYLPSVLERFALFSRCMPTAAIGYDALPMTEPANYRFPPGSAAWVSEYFRLLAVADSVVCISEYARDSILGRLRRDPARPICVAHPGGDHIPIRPPGIDAPPVFVRLGTLEARKRPIEILRAFRLARARGVHAELVFVGGASASDSAINDEIATATREPGIRWVQHATDTEVHALVHAAGAMLSVGVEGYGIPVLEAIRLGTPVLFDGIQPAADLMLGGGAFRIDASTPETLADALEEAARPGMLGGMHEGLRPESVPTWATFAQTVADHLVD